MSKLDEYFKKIAKPKIRSNAAKFVNRIGSNDQGKPFIGQVSDDGYYVYDPNGQGYNLIRLGNPGRVDIAVPVSSDTAVMVNEQRQGLSSDVVSNDAYISFQTVAGSNYIRKVIALATEDVSSPTNPFEDFIGYKIPENILKAGVTPDNYVVLFSCDGKHIAVGITYLDNITLLHPDATGHFFAEWFVIENFELTDDPIYGPIIKGTNFDPITLTDPRDGSSVKKTYDLSLAFDGFSKGPAQFDPDNPIADPRRSRIFMWQPGDLVPLTGSIFRPLVTGKNKSDGDSGEYKVDFSGGGYIEHDIGGEESTYHAVWKCHVETKMQMQQSAFAFNSDPDGKPVLDLVIAAQNTGVYYLFSNDVDQRLWTNQTYGDGTGINAFGGFAIAASYWKCSWHHNQNAVFGIPDDEDKPPVHDTYNFPRDWIGNPASIEFGSSHVGILKNPPVWVQPTGTFAEVGQPTEPDPKDDLGVYQGTEYWQVDGAGGSNTTGDNQFNHSDFILLPKGSLLRVDRGGSNSTVCEPAGTGGSAEDITVFMLFISEYNVSQFFDGGIQNSEDVPFTDSFATLPIVGLGFTIDLLRYNEIRYYSIYAQGYCNVYTFETNILTVQALNYASQTSQSPNSDASTSAVLAPARCIESFAFIGQGDTRTLYRAFRSIEGRSALLYNFQVGIGLGDQTDIAHNGVTLDDILANFDALADGQFVPGLSGEIQLKHYKITMVDVDYENLLGQFVSGVQVGDQCGIQIGGQQYIYTVQDGDHATQIMKGIMLLVQQSVLPDFTTCTIDGDIITVISPEGTLMQVFTGGVYHNPGESKDYHYENLQIDQFSRSNYWEIISPYGTQVQQTFPDGHSEPDGHCVSDKWYFPAGTFPFPFENIKATDSDVFLVQVTGQFFGEGGILLPQIYDFLYEYEIKTVPGGFAMVPTGLQASSPRPTVAGAILQDYTIRKTISIADHNNAG